MSLKAIDKLIAASGPDLVQTDIKFVGEDGQEIIEKIWIKRLSWTKANKLFVSMLTDDGSKVDPRKYAPAQIDAIAATLCDESGAQAYPRDEIEKWPPAVIVAVHSVVKKFNDRSVERVQEAQGNSSATPSSDSATG